MRVLLIEDDATLRRVILRTLQEAGCRVDEAGDLACADHLWRVQMFDAVILDLNLPHSSSAFSGLGSGLSALRAARLRGDHTPVLVLTARNTAQDRVSGLNTGADDYLGKPFDMDELLARLRALVRRSQRTSAQVEVGALRLDRPAQRIFLRGEDLNLPTREFEVLRELMSPCGRVVSKGDLSAKLSEVGEILTENALEAFISRLRKRLTTAGVQIRTIRGLGYLLEEAS
jgi:two-component system, OmpR family, response regulator